MNRGTFIVSLDCEGKWGFVDKISEHHHRLMTNENLVAAYRKLLDLFRRHELPATFAFVVAFTFDENERLIYRQRLRDVVYEGRDWLRFFKQSEAKNVTDGWFCPEALEITRQNPEHEIGCHGLSHLPLLESKLGRAEAEYELKTAWQIATEKGISLETFVYPRNLIGYTDLLKETGFIGYRERKQRFKGRAERIRALAAELNIMQGSQPHLPANGGTVRIPPGEFFNWRAGFRKKIPQMATVARWKSILRSAANNGEVAHLWLHPHNIIDGPQTFDVLKQVLREASKLRAAGRLEFQTQATYARYRISQRH